MLRSVRSRWPGNRYFGRRAGGLRHSFREERHDRGASEPAERSRSTRRAQRVPPCRGMARARSYLRQDSRSTAACFVAPRPSGSACSGATSTAGRREKLKTELVDIQRQVPGPARQSRRLALPPLAPPYLAEWLEQVGKACQVRPLTVALVPERHHEAHLAPRLAVSGSGPRLRRRNIQQIPSPTWRGGQASEHGPSSSPTPCSRQRSRTPGRKGSLPRNVAKLVQGAKEPARAGRGANKG